MDKAKFLSSFSRKSCTLNYEGQTIRIVEFSALTRQEVGKMIGEGRNGEAFALTSAVCVVDEKGNRIFDDADAEKLAADMPPALLDAIFTAVTNLSKGDPEKN